MPSFCTISFRAHQTRSIMGIMTAVLVWRRLVLWIGLPALLFAGGLWMRTLPSIAIPRVRRSPDIVTLYFPDGPYLLPVSRRLASAGNLPRTILENLLTGPGRGSALRNPFPPGLQLRSLEIADSVAHIDLSAELDESARRAIVETMTGLPQIDAVAFSVNGQSRAVPIRRTPLAYYASVNALIAVPVSGSTPQQMITRYLLGPPDPSLTGLPPDVQLLKYDYDAASRAVALNFTYTPSVRTLALEQPDRMRFVLLGLIASLTELPQVETVELDFEGKTRLGVGQCSDLLRIRLRRPDLLNDERLLPR